MVCKTSQGRGVVQDKVITRLKVHQPCRRQARSTSVQLRAVWSPPPQPGQIPCGTGLQAMRCGWAGNACTATRRLAACAYHTTCVCSETCGNCLRCTGGCLSIRTLGDGPGSQDIWIAKACGLHAIMAFSLAALEYILCKTEVRVSLGGAAR